MAQILRQTVSDFPLQDEGKVLFLIGLMGWMPTAVDMSSWNSLWTLDKEVRKEQGLSPLSLKEVITNFASAIGYQPF